MQDPRLLCENLTVSDGARLLFNGFDTVELLKKYGSPAYVFDEDRLRANCRVYVDAMKTYFGESALPLYAGKAASFVRMIRIAHEEGMGLDVVSAGELKTACVAGFPLDKVYYHGNNKTDEEIADAIAVGVGQFIVDSEEELDAIDAIAAEHGVKQKILLRLTPGIDPHTFEAVATGKVDSKFGFAIETGDAERITRNALKKEHVELVGFHSHVGSQVFDSAVFFDSAAIMVRFMAEIRDKYGFTARELNLGGGYGVRYEPTDPVIDIADNLRQVAENVKGLCERYALPFPAMRLEPGRSIVADAGITLYTVGSVKRIEGYKNYVSIDGGMGDDPRFALYGSRYTVVVANKMREKADFIADLVGRYCESGDVIAEKAAFPASVRRGDVIAVFTTGAYNYSMASNYNRVPRLPVVMVSREKGDYLAVKRETPDDVVRLDL